MINRTKILIFLFSILLLTLLLFFVLIFKPFYQQHLLLYKEENMVANITRDAQQISSVLKLRRKQMERLKKNSHHPLSLNELERDLQGYSLSVVGVHQQHQEIQLTLAGDGYNFFNFLAAQTQKSPLMQINSLVIEPRQITLVLRDE